MVAGGSQSHKDALLEASAMARYMPYLHPAFLLGRAAAAGLGGVGDYHAAQLLRSYSGAAAYMPPAPPSAHGPGGVSPRDYILRADAQHQAGLDKMGVGGPYDATKLAQAYAKARLQQASQWQNSHVLSGKGGAEQTLFSPGKLALEDDVTDAKHRKLSASSRTSQHVQQRLHFGHDVKGDVDKDSDDLIDVEDSESLTSPVKTLDLSLKGETSPHLLSPAARNHELFGRSRHAAKLVATPESRVKSGLDHLTSGSSHVNKFSSPDSCGSATTTTSGIVSDRELDTTRTTSGSDASDHSPGSGVSVGGAGGALSPGDDDPLSPGLTSPLPATRDAPPSGAAVNKGNKTFTCLECGKVFNAHYNLTRHMPVHTGARPFICKICGKGNELSFLPVQAHGIRRSQSLLQRFSCQF